MDLVAMAVRDVGLRASDDAHNLTALQEQRLLEARLVADLRRLDGLRDAVGRGFRSHDVPGVREALEEMEEILVTLMDAV